MAEKDGKGRRRRRGRLRTRLQAGLLGALLLPLLAIGLYGSWAADRALEEATVAQARRELAGRAAAVEALLAEAQADLAVLSHLEDLRTYVLAEGGEGSRDRVLEAFLGYAVRHPAVRRLAYLDRGGGDGVGVECDGRGCREARTDVLPRPSLPSDSLPEGEVALFVPEAGTPTPRLQLLTPVPDPAHPSQGAGLLLLEVEATPLQELLAGPGGRTALFDAEGRLLAASDGGPLPSQVAELLRAPERVVEVPPLSGPQAAAVRLLPALPGLPRPQVLLAHPFTPLGAGGPTWILVRQQPRVPVAPALELLRWGLLAGLLLAAAFALAAGARTARWIQKPLEAVTAGLREAAEGRWDRRLPAAGPAEVADLAAAFNALMDEVQTRVRRLSILGRTGREIPARLDPPEVLAAALDLLLQIYPQTHGRIDLRAEGPELPTLTVEGGDPQTGADPEEVEGVLQGALWAEVGSWHHAALTGHGGRPIYLCCAPFGEAGAFRGVLAVWGSDPDLIAPSVGETLAALGAQVAAALENARRCRQTARERDRFASLAARLLLLEEERRAHLAEALGGRLLERLILLKLRLSQRPLVRPGAPAGGVDELEEAIAQAERLRSTLRPAPRTRTELADALRDLLQEEGQRAGWQTRFHAPVSPFDLDGSTAVAAFRIAEEALANAARHARTPRVTLSLLVEEEGITLTVQDWGVGFDPAQVWAARPLGLTAMEAWARAVGGRLQVESRPGDGTAVRAWLPRQIASDRSEPS